MPDLTEFLYLTITNNSVNSILEKEKHTMSQKIDVSLFDLKLLIVATVHTHTRLCHLRLKEGLPADVLKTESRRNIRQGDYQGTFSVSAPGEDGSRDLTVYISWQSYPLWWSDHPLWWKAPYGFQ